MNAPEQKKIIAPTVQPANPLKPQQIAAPVQPAAIPKLDDIKYKTDAEKKAILGSHLYPRIIANLTEE